MQWAGQKIKTIAKQKNITIVNIAEQIGVSRQAVNDWIRGKIPKGQHLISLSKILDVQPDFFFSMDADPVISIPSHRTRKGAKVTSEMEQFARQLAEEYKVLFLNAHDPDLVPILKIGERSNENAIKIAQQLRQMSGISEYAPIDYNHTFKLMDKLGIFIIYRDFPRQIKGYAFYSNINNHRVVFVNNSTNIIDLIFPLLHESIHAIRENEYQNTEYDKREEDFCDLIANHVQFPEKYIATIYNKIIGKNEGSQINCLKTFGTDYSHSLYGIIKRIKEIDRHFNLNVGGADTNLKKDFQTIGQIIFDTNDAEEYINRLKDFSPKFINIIAKYIESISTRKIGEILGVDNLLDSIELKNYLYKVSIV